jgi:hypothetical protein
MEQKRMNNKIELVNIAVKKAVKWLVLIVSFASISSMALAQDLLKDGYPERYEVKKGDTLWAIAGQYLNQPWRWPELWQANSDIENPDLIYPGDVLVLTMENGKPILRSLKSASLAPKKRETIKLRPKVRESDYANSVAPISPEAILPFIFSPLVTTADEINSSAYIVDGVGNRLVGGKGDQMYARGLKDTSKADYQIFRSGRVFVHPVTGETLGLEAEDVGTATLLQAGDTARVAILDTNGTDVVSGDFLRPINPSDSVPFFFPQVHSTMGINGLILPAVTNNAELGKFDIVAVSIGERELAKPGQVFKIMSQARLKLDPTKKDEAFVIPQENVGLLMLIRVFEKVSYAIVTDATRPVNIGDTILHPEAWVDHQATAAKLLSQREETTLSKIKKIFSPK